MASILGVSSTIGSCESSVRILTRSRAYSVCCNATYRTHNSLPGSWSTLGHTGSLLKSPSRSAYTNCLWSRPALTLSSDSKNFSTSSAVEISKARYDKLRLAPDAMKAHLIKLLEYSKRYFDNNSEARQRHKAANRVSRVHLSAIQENYAKSRKLVNWIHSYSWIREMLPWKSHQPLMYNAPAQHYCDGCRAIKRT
jgi:hypothetical protein